VTLWQRACFIDVDRKTMEVYVHREKLAPARMHYFIVEQLNDLAVRGKVLSVLVQESAYLVRLSLADRGVTFRQLSPYDVSRSLRGDPDALAMVRADLLRDVAVDITGGLTEGSLGAAGATIAREATTGT
jgi:hypothetical protein